MREGEWLKRLAAEINVRADVPKTAGAAMAIIRVLAGEVWWWLPIRSILLPVILHVFDLLLCLPVPGTDTAPLTGFAMALDAQHYVHAHPS